MNYKFCKRINIIRFWFIKDDIFKWMGIKFCNISVIISNIIWVNF